MVQAKQIFKCDICDNTVEALHGGIGELFCCNQPMIQLGEKTQDEGLERHVPVIEKTDKGIKVTVGSQPHPMEKDHFIEWIELIINGQAYHQFLYPGQKPEAEFCIQDHHLEDRQRTIFAREHCNLHGLWKASL